MTKHELRNGVRLLLEPMPNVRSASAGLWLEVGSRDETSAESGICHVIEHMFFKGSQNRDVLEMNDAMNRLGGHFNAFTSQEIVCLHARLIDEQLAGGLDLLAELLLSPRYPEDELQRERNVILEECKMIEDTPDDLVMELFHQAIWGDHPVGRPVIGRPETISSFQRDGLMRFAADNFSPERLIVSVAGAMDHQAVRAQCERLFGDMPSTPERPNSQVAPQGAFQRRVREKDIEQAQFCLGSIGPSRPDEDRYRFAALNTILGGGMSSRIYKEVREKRGLAYSVGSLAAGFRDTGYFGIAGGTSPEHLETVIELSLRETRALYAEDARPDELELAKEQLKTSIVFALENTGARMTRMAEQEIYYGRFTAVDEILSRIEAVTLRDVREAAAKWLQDAPPAFALVAPDSVPEVRLTAF
jgi:predicted Zn-dependent peptidase